MASSASRASGSSRLAAGLSLGAAVAVAALGISKASFVAGDTDAFGYVSEADLIAHGSLRIEQQFVRTLPWPFADWSFAPSGYRPATSRGFIVPTYAPGVPLVMALFERLFGTRRAVFYVVPLLGALCVWMTSLLGTSVQGRLTGLLAAVLVAASPSFLIELMAPASDVAVTAWWTMSLAFAVWGGRGAALSAGLAASLAILTRPNLVPLAALIGIFFLCRAVRDRVVDDRAARNQAGRENVIRLALFVLGAVPGCLAVAAVNQRLYGSPLRSGYEPLGALYALTNIGPNLDRYPRWLMQTETPFIALALAAPIFARAKIERTATPRLAPDHVALLLAFSFAMLLSYLFYRPFGRDEWTYLRFLLPAYPALLILAVAVTIEITQLLIINRLAAAVTATAICLVVAGWLGHQSINRGALAARFTEGRYVDVGRYIEATMPSNSVFIARLHSGSIRYYSGRLTMQYEWLERRWLDEAVKELAGRGYRPFIALEEDEEGQFRERFAASNKLGRLDWPPMAERRDPVRVRLYDPLDRERFQRGERIATQPIQPARRW